MVRFKKPGEAEERSVLLDRYFAYDLTSYCSDVANRRTEHFATKYRTLYRVLSQCILFYDTILIENQYASSISWKLSKDELNAFNSIFSVFSFEDLPLSIDERLTIEESVDCDCHDPEYTALIDTYYSDRGTPRLQNFREIVRYVNWCILAAESKNMDICPFSNRSPLFEYKFNNINRFASGRKCLELTQNTVDILVPNLEIKDISQILEIRENKYVKSFRTKIRELAENAIENEAAEGTINIVLEEFLDASSHLLSGVQSDSLSKVQMAASWFVPFPINAAVDVTREVLDHFCRKKHRWIFFIYNLREVSRGEAK